ncbi:hypothetical protein CPB85DRAFT_291286 [Mucidula mucida]|nr:hypothetical protein CPB85DRAFT_291286 [Mucidula mucida]
MYTVLLDLLDHTQLLETLKLWRVTEPTPGHNARIVIHNFISTFQLDTISQQENDAVFQHATFLWPQQSNITFLRRSGCTLTELSFRHCKVNEALLVQMLRSQKALTTLQLNAFNGPRYILDHVPIPMSTLDFLSTKPKGVSQLPVPAVWVIRLVILPRHFKRTKRLVQSRFGDQARSSRVAELREVDIVVDMQQTPSN